MTEPIDEQISAAQATWKIIQPVPNWRDALNRFAIEFADRMPTSH